MKIDASRGHTNLHFGPDPPKEAVGAVTINLQAGAGCPAPV